MNTEFREPGRLALISKSALEHNLSVLAQGLDFVDVSANGYGHGASTVIDTAAALGFTSFGVRHPGDAAKLRLRYPGLTIEAGLFMESDQTESLYGLRSESGFDIKPVMTLSAEVVAVKQIKAGGGVSYGYTWRAPEDGFLALIALGYADGFNRAWGNRVSAFSGAQAFPAVGRVAMDAHSISTDQEKLSVGQHVHYFGAWPDHQVFADELARTIGCSPLAIPAILGNRVDRRVAP